jgi:hypothetical protein
LGRVCWLAREEVKSKTTVRVLVNNLRVSSDNFDRQSGFFIALAARSGLRCFARAQFAAGEL